MYAQAAIHTHLVTTSLVSSSFAYLLLDLGEGIRDPASIVTTDGNSDIRRCQDLEVSPKHQNQAAGEG